MKFSSLKKLSVFALSLFVVASVGISPIAASASTTDNKEVKNLEAKYNLSSISIKDIPSDVKPLKFDSVEEADKYIQQFKEKSEALSNGTVADVQLANKSSKIADSTPKMMLASTTGYQEKKVETTGISSIWIGVSYTYSGSSFGKCTGVNSFITGFTTGVKYTHDYGTSSIIDGGRTLHAAINGTETLYIIVNGIGDIYTQKIYDTADFYL